MAEQAAEGHGVVDVQACAGEQLADRRDQQEGQRTAVDAHAILAMSIQATSRSRGPAGPAPAAPPRPGQRRWAARVGVGDAGEFLQRRAGLALKDAAVGKAHLDRFARSSRADTWLCVRPAIAVNELTAKFDSAYCN